MHERFASSRTLNPDAGEHAVSAHPAEQAAAEAATRLSWREFPYYAKRYGERGWRFSLSDSGWIQTLCELSSEPAKAQILWLANLLAARGMPRYLLERHLDHLHAELLAGLPDRGVRYEVLRALAAHLRAIRVGSVAESTFAQVNAEFDAGTASCTERVKNMGSVIVAAVADDQAGVGNVLESVVSWAKDPARFDSVWIAAVDSAVERVRAGAASVRK
jgi:hypothetical protein